MNYNAYAMNQSYPYATSSPLQTMSAPQSSIPAPGQFPLFITISGILGAGKSTLATALAEKLQLPVFYEPVKENVYLEDFYKDIAKYAFPMQIYLLNQRFRQQQQIIWSKRGGVQDRSIYEDAIFAKMLYEGGNMEQRDYDTYMELFSNMSHFMQRPNIIVHLDVTPEESLRRIKLRSRECESSVSIDYLRALHKGYEDFLADISKTIPVIKVNYQDFPSIDEMVDQITIEYGRISNIRMVWYDQQPQSVQQRQKDEEDVAVAKQD